jgi:hypothetical protein
MDFELKNGCTYPNGLQTYERLIHCGYEDDGQ